MRTSTTLIVVASLLITLSICTALQAIPVTGNLQVHFDANELAVVSDGTSVTSWADQSGNGRNLTTVTGTAPQYFGSAMNGMPVVRFVGTGALSTAAFSTDIDMSTSDMTTFVVFQTTTVDRGTFFSFNSVTNNNQVFSYINRFTDDPGPGTGDLFPTYDASSSNVVSQALTDQAYNNGAAHVFTADTDGSTNTSYGDSGTAKSYSEAGDTNDLDQLYVGALNGGSSTRLTGDVAEIVTYNLQLNIAERLISENHLAAKYSGTGSTLLVGNDLYEGDDAGNGNYDFDVIGIGQQSSASLTASPVGEGGGLEISEANSSLDNGEYLLAGNDGTAHGLTPAEGLTGDRWTRIYYLDMTGDFEATLAFDYGDAGLTTPTGSNFYSLLYSPATGPIAWEQVGSGSLSGDQVQFLINTAQLANGLYSLTVTPVPEPSSFLLLGLGALGLVRHRRRKVRQG